MFFGVNGFKHTAQVLGAGLMLAVLGNRKE